MEILVLSPYPPYPPQFGGPIRVYQLMRVLAREHAVTLLCFATAAERAALAPLEEVCAAVHAVDPPAGRRRPRPYQLRSLVGRAYSYYACYSREMAAALAAVLARRQFDLVQVEFSQMGYYSLPGGVVRVLDEHNVEHALLRQMGRRERSLARRLYAAIQSRRFRRDELAACRRADAVLATSEVDRQALAADLGDVLIRVVPNGVDTRFFTPGRREAADLLLFTGAMTYPPNTDAMRHFCADVLPRVRASVPDVSLAIVGREPPAALRRLSGAGIEVTGTVPDVRPWLERAAVFVAPLRLGSGTRLKILEAMASGRAVVSTTIGCQGLDVTDGEDILIADTPAAFAAAIVRCLRDPALRARLGARGRQLVERRYEWETIGRELGAFYRELTARIGRRGVEGPRPAPGPGDGRHGPGRGGPADRGALGIAARPR